MMNAVLEGSECMSEGKVLVRQKWIGSTWQTKEIE